jgi:HAD superfamily hydrolase (TIGR01549 family)
MIKAVLFDFSQTLADTAEGFRLAEKEAKTRLFADLELDSWGGFQTTYRNTRREFHGKSNFSRLTFFQEIYFQFGQEPDPAFLAVLENEYWQTVRSKTTLFPETEEVLEQLASRYRLASITNTQGKGTPGDHLINLFPELKNYFEYVVIAGEAGIPPKPKQAPFLICLERLGIDPCEAVYVGDDFEIDIRGGQGVGIQPIWLKHH